MTFIMPIQPKCARHEPRLSSPVFGRSSRSIQIGRAATLVAADCIAFILSIGSAAMLTWQTLTWDILFGSPVSAPPSSLLSGCALFGSIILIFAARAHYWRRIPFWSELRDVLAASVLALLCDGFVQYSLQHHDSRLFLGLTWTLFPGLVMLMRKLGRSALSSAGAWQLRAVIVGRDEMAKEAQSALLSEPNLGYQVVDVICPTEPDLRQSGGQWKRVLVQRDADLLVLALDANDIGARELTESLVRARVPFAAIPRLSGLPVLGFDQTSFFSHDTVMFAYRNNLARPVARLAKLLFDFVAALCILIALSPLLLLIALAVKSDGGPVLFAHRRVGANGREFRCFKFRSMVPDGDAVLHRHLESNADAAAEWAATRKLRRDPRVTTIGRILRSTSLDELPQLLNVLRLEMSLVGPRPIVQSEVPRYAEDITYYYETRPGLTGLWQVSGRSETSYERRVQLDTWYVKNWTIWHDLAILAKTLPAVLNRRGAI
jgi:Undecaprenyl-phosphate galactose phosphotransferase WbaP